MSKPIIYRTFEVDGTKFIVVKKNEDGYTHFFNGSGRLNFSRPVQSYDAFMLNAASYMTALRYVLRGEFVLRENVEEYYFDPSDDGWIIKYNGGTVKIQGDDLVMEIISSSLNMKSFLKNQKADEPANVKSIDALTKLSDMLRDSQIDKDELERISRIAENTNDERLRDMIKIARKKLCGSQGSEDEVIIQIIE
jgi:hypothetical protein